MSFVWKDLQDGKDTASAVPINELGRAVEKMSGEFADKVDKEDNMGLSTVRAAGMIADGSGGVKLSLTYQDGTESENSFYTVEDVDNKTRELNDNISEANNAASAAVEIANNVGTDVEDLKNELTGGEYRRMVLIYESYDGREVTLPETEYHFSAAGTALEINPTFLTNGLKYIGAEIFIYFISGETPPTIVTQTYNNYVWRWLGDDCKDGEFTPQANTAYEVSIKVVPGKLVCRVAVV